MLYIQTDKQNGNCHILEAMPQVVDDDFEVKPATLADYMNAAPVRWAGERTIEVAEGTMAVRFQPYKRRLGSPDVPQKLEILDGPYKGVYIGVEGYKELLGIQSRTLTQPRSRGYMHPTEGWVSGGWPD